ncbi:UNVERIFIED_ORG: VOC family protein [Roseateles sp. XES5]|nr:VOC family protein [Roseateles sp. XES5]
MLHHIEIYVSNLDISHAFWTSLLGQIGYEESGRWDDGFTLAHGDEAYLTFVQVADRHADRGYHRCAVGLNHLAFRVEDRKTVDRLREFCRANGVSCLYDERYPFANGGRDYYALFIEDPDRIKVEFVADPI